MRREGYGSVESGSCFIGVRRKGERTGEREMVTGKGVKKKNSLKKELPCAHTPNEQISNNLHHPFCCSPFVSPPPPYHHYFQVLRTHNVHTIHLRVLKAAAMSNARQKSKGERKCQTVSNTNMISSKKKKKTKPDTSSPSDNRLLARQQQLKSPS